MRPWIAASFIAALCWPAAAHAQAPAAEALFDQGRDAMKRGDLDTACARFRASDQLDPAAGTRLNLGDCEERRGRVASAWEAFRAALAKMPAGDSRIAVAQARIAALKLRLPWLTLTLAPGAPPGTTVREGDKMLGTAATFGVPLPLDPGVHQLTVLAPGHAPRPMKVTLFEAKVVSLVVAPSLAERAAPPPPPHPGRVPRDERHPPATPPPTLSHRGQFGAVLRADIDALRAGLVAAPGLSYGIGHHFEVSAGALVGKSKGFEPGARVLFLKGRWKPTLALSAPIFFIDGVRPGVRAAAGIQWDPIRHVGVFVEAAVAGFPTLPDGYQHIVFVPAIGVQPRL
jgi:hypothetical protein